jgi:hypothetical protein
MIDSGFDRLRVQRGHPVNASLNWDLLNSSPLNAKLVYILRSPSLSLALSHAFQMKNETAVGRQLCMNLRACWFVWDRIDGADIVLSLFEEIFIQISATERKRSETAEEIASFGWWGGAVTVMVVECRILLQRCYLMSISVRHLEIWNQ